MANSAADFYFTANAKEVVQAINGIQSRLRKLEKTGAKKATEATGQQMQQLGADFQIAAAGAKALHRILGLGYMVTFAAGAVKAVGAINAFGNACVNAASEMETYQTRFTTLLGDTETAQAHLEQLNQYAAKTPFEISGISQASASLLSFGIKAEESHEVLRMLGDVAAASGASLQELAQIYGKVNTAGKLDTQDINQLATRALNLRELFAARDNLTGDEVKKRISGGEYGVEDLRWAIEKETREGGAFYKGAENLSNTYSGLVSTLKDDFRALQSDLGEMVLPTMKNMVKQGVAMVNTWGPPLKKAIKDLGRGMRDFFMSTEATGSSMSRLDAIVATFKLEPFREMVRLRKEEYAAEQELARLTGETLNKTEFEIAAERRLAEETRQRALQEQIAADNAERAAKAAEKEAETRKRMRADLAADRAKREAEAARDLFASQSSAGMKAELAYRFRQATGKEWQGIAGMDEAALRAAEDKAARKADAGALAELAALREYAGLYAETLQKEIEVQNQRTAALDAARAAEVQASELADARERGDLAAVQDLEAAAAAERKYAELRGLGMEHAEAANWAAGAAGREHGAGRAATAPGEWMRDDLAAVGGGGAAIRIPNAQLAVQRQQLSAAQLTNKLLEKLLQKPATVTGLPVVP